MENGTSRPGLRLLSSFLLIVPLKEALKNFMKEARVTELIKIAASPKRMNTGILIPPMMVAW